MQNENQNLPTNPLKQLNQDWQVNVTSITQLQIQCNEELAAIKSRTQLICETAAADHTINQTKAFLCNNIHATHDK